MCICYQNRDILTVYISSALYQKAQTILTDTFSIHMTYTVFLLCIKHKTVHTLTSSWGLSSRVLYVMLTRLVKRRPGAELQNRLVEPNE